MYLPAAKLLVTQLRTALRWERPVHARPGVRSRLYVWTELRRSASLRAHNQRNLAAPSTARVNSVKLLSTLCVSCIALKNSCQLPTPPSSSSTSLVTTPWALQPCAL